MRFWHGPCPRNSCFHVNPYKSATYGNQRRRIAAAYSSFDFSPEPRSPYGQRLKALRNEYWPCSRNIFAVRSGDQGIAKRSGRSAIQNAVNAIKVAVCVSTSAFTASNASFAEVCGYL